jgi:selT/selW/selH-like putative selenoprotein
VRQAFPNADVRLIESSGGAFEVTVDGALVFSKLRTGRHPDDGEVLRLIHAHRGDVR